METHIAILNGNGIHHLPAPPGRGSTWKDCRVVAINNFSNFGVDRTVIYYRSEVERVATSLNKTFFPGAELEPAPRLAARMHVKAVLGTDLGPNNRPQPRRFRSGSQGLSQPGPAPYNGFRLKPAHTRSGLCYNIIDKIV